MAEYEEQAKRSRKEVIETLKGRKQKDNILLVGNAGSGKSSLINTMSQALTGKWNPQARAGRSGGASPVTDRVRWYNDCNVIKIGSGFRREWLPNLVDMAGYAGHDLEQWKHILLGIMEGRIADGTSMTNLLAELDRSHHYISALDVDESKKITKIVFVATVTEDINEELMQSVIDIARGTSGNREIQVYGALTHCDRIGQSGDTGVLDMTARTRRSTMVSCLHMLGTEDDYFSDIKNYSSHIRPPNYEIEAISLNFLKIISVQRPNDGDSSGSNRSNLKIRMRIKLKQFEDILRDNTFFGLMVFAFAGFVFAFIINSLWTNSIVW
ncbi:hypothetical protein ScPMuIL_003321 [Solemya velum]